MILRTDRRAAKYFNPRPRKEGDGSKKDISKPRLYFNPRPRKEGDAWNMILSPRSRDFNPRPRKEGDVTTGLYLLCFLLISIHALVKRATSFHCLYYNVPLYFNPRPRKEGDHLLCNLFWCGVLFQSTPS